MDHPVKPDDASCAPSRLPCIYRGDKMAITGTQVIFKGEISD
jgi:hypothetical protein